MASKDRERAENKLKRELEQLEASKQASASERKSRIVIIGAVVLVVILGGMFYWYSTFDAGEIIEKTLQELQVNNLKAASAIAASKRQ